MQKSIFFLFLSASLFAGGQEFQSLGTFSLESGDTIPNCRIGFRRFGLVNEDSSNILIVPTWFSGKSQHVAALVGPEKLLDSTRYHIIIIDALGNGISSSPSNSSSQPRDEFPDITIADMVRSQYFLLHRKLGIQRVFAMVGGSMGGMQVFQWWAMYPGFMDKAVSYVGSPWPTTYSRLVWEAERSAIREGLKYGLSDSLIMQSVAAIQILNAYTPAYRNRETGNNEVNDFLKAYLQRFSKNYDHYDWLCQLGAMLNHDIRPWLADNPKNLPPLYCLVSQTDHLVTPENTIAFAEQYHLPLHRFTNDCGHLAPGCEMKTFVRLVNSFLNDHE